MRYLKLFESANPADYFKELEQKTGIGIIKPEIDDLFVDLKDNLSNIEITDDLIINLTYRRKNVRKSTLSYTYFDNALKKGYKLPASDINYLKDFLDKCEIATKINMEYGVRLYLQFDNSEDLLTLKEEVKNIELRSKSLGYNFYVNDSSEMGRAVKDPNKSIDDIINNDQTIRGWQRRGYTTIFLLFECDLDESRLKSSIDFKSQIPANIISDFDKFVDKFRIPSKDKQELINIIKRGNWSED
jgi:hypothetical protein